MPAERRFELADVRLDKAKECLEVAEMLIASGHLADSANRSYYCIFHAMRAVLALDKFDSKKHSGISSTFREKYIKPKIFSKDLSKIIDEAFTVRNKSDYDDFYIIDKSDVVQQNQNAKSFLSLVEEYINSLRV
jgi:uncharacterized protein (UPF0332 family)